MERRKAIEILLGMVKDRVGTDDMDTTIRMEEEKEAVEQAIVDMKVCAYHNGEWTSVEERLPDPWEPVLCAIERTDNGRMIYSLDQINDETGNFYIHNTLDLVKYWMPLPKLPEEEYDE